MLSSGQEWIYDYYDMLAHVEGRSGQTDEFIGDKISQPPCWLDGDYYRYIRLAWVVEIKVVFL